MGAVKDILVVDDSRTELVFLRNVLARKGYHVRTAENAEQAMQQLTTQIPDLILMDVVMPGTNGFQLTRTIARHPEYGRVPVFICSSKNLETDRVWGMRQGARDYITKPVDPEQLLAKIEALA
jgi:twitching motility two-component system response regulator PilH